ncbi:MAG: FAD-dependent oxidoreductase [Ignavibacteria bacterium]|nr:FAD-dependent oxidoreductase [Ignavibacteria bacterium]
MNLQTNFLRLNIPGFSFYDLFIPQKLAELTRHFFDYVRHRNPEACKRFEEYLLHKGAGLSAVEVSKRLTDIAPYLSTFVTQLFCIEEEVQALRDRADRERIIFTFKTEFFSRRALKKISRQQSEAVRLDVRDGQVEALLTILNVLPDADDELRAASAIMKLVTIEKSLLAGAADELRNDLDHLANALRKSDRLKEFAPDIRNDVSFRKLITDLLGIAEEWLVAHYYRKTDRMRGWVTFKLPRAVDYKHLVEVQPASENGPSACIGPEEHHRRRDGFDLTDSRYNGREVMSEVDYCIICHKRDKDSCTKGILENGSIKKNPLGYPLNGCPLDQKISESHMLESQGDAIGALAIIMIDNPMCPGTGHRICNDCMKSCIFQKQDPVNIPQAETGILTDVLQLPWGFEIYSLLTRWNPLNINRPHALPFNGKKILIVGMGPAGYTLAHYFLNEGFGIVGIDGLKIEPLPDALVGSATVPFAPVRDVSTLFQKLSERILIGFGGVSEYGITVRWDKNFLTVIYLNLLRREYFRLYDGVRFGGTVTLEDAWDLGFDHVCLATGAGKPTFVSMKNNLIRGIRKASDFLMALQLTGAARKDSMANLQVQLPAIIIGGGLTAIDTATELMAYYPIQVAKIKQRYEALIAQYGKESIDAVFSEEDRSLLQTYLSHATAIENERQRAKSAGEQPNFIPLIRAWGGVHIYYRKSLVDSPAYRLNHEEVIKSLEEGISFVEKMSPIEAVPDDAGAVKEMIFERLAIVDGKWKSTGEASRIPARSVMVAAGTVPNIMYEREHPNTFALDEREEFFESYAMKDVSAGNFRMEKAQENEVGFFTSHESNGRYVSYYGDNHPDYEGNVVKAMASAKHGFRKVLELFDGKLTAADAGGIRQWKNLIERLDDELKPRVVEVNRLTSTIVEVIVRAPRAAQRFEPGQFYRLQNYEVDSPKVENTLLMMEGIALTGAWVDKKRGLLSLIVLEFGASSRLCSTLKPGQRVVVMGPTGTPTEIDEHSTTLLLGGGLGNAVLFSIAKAFKGKKSKVIYFAGYRKAEDLFKREEIEAATDVVVYSVDQGESIPTRRPQDKSFVGNIVQAMVAYASGGLGETAIPLRDAHRLIAIGSDRMMAAVADARHTVLQPHLNDRHIGIASINSSMQCMMKAVCAQCLQRHVIPGTNEEVFVFSCVNQDQKMDEVDFTNLNRRLKVNSLMEKISDRWLRHLFEEHDFQRV